MVAEQRLGKNEAVAAMQLIAASNADRSLSVAKTDLTAKYQENVAQVSELKQTVVTSNQAFAQQITSVQATVGQNSALIQSEQTARVNADYALANRIDTVQASVSQNTALIQSEQTARANADGALSSRIDTVTATANGASASVQSVATAVANINGDLSAMQTIKTQVVAGGRTIFAGIGVGVNSKNGIAESQVLLSAQRVAFIDEVNGVTTTPFVVQNGQTFINQAFIGNAYIDTLRIGGNAVTVIQGAASDGWGLVRSVISVAVEDIPPGQSTIPIIVTGAQDVLSQTFFDLSVNQANYGAPGNLLAATPPIGGTWSYTAVFNAAPGVYEFNCYNHGAGDVSDPNTRRRSLPY
jgi:predicted phage tail protein